MIRNEYVVILCLAQPRVWASGRLPPALEKEQTGPAIATAASVDANKGHSHIVISSIGITTNPWRLKIYTHVLDESLLPPCAAGDGSS